jgi:hypothetical protein
MATTKPKLTIAEVQRWADAHRRRTGRWPTARSGPVAEAPGDAWNAVAGALRDGWRGLPGGTSLALLLAEHRGRRTRVAVPLLTEAQVLAWADARRARTGRWPTAASGPVADAPGEHWAAVNSALRVGLRGLVGGSLSRLLVRQGRREALAARSGRDWSAAEDELVRTLTPVEAARHTGRSLSAVCRRRHKLGATDARKRG